MASDTEQEKAGRTPGSPSGAAEGSKTAKERLSNGWKGIVAFSAGLGVLGALLANGKSIISVVLPKHEPALKTYSYARLFGAFQVPYVMYPSEFKSKMDTGTHLVQLDYKRTSEDWRQGALHDANFAQGPIYDELKVATDALIEKSTDTSLPIFSMLTKQNPSFVDDYKILDRNMFGLDSGKVRDIETRLLGGNFHGPSYVSKLYSAAKAELDRSVSKVVFTFLVVENEENKSTPALSISYDLFKNDRPFRDGFQTSDHIVPSGVAPTKQTMEITSLAPHEKLLLLLSVGICGEDGYPTEFVSSVIIPNEISRDGASTTTIRKPLLYKAAKMILPMGWYQQ